MLENRYNITSNREAGYGRFDIQMLPLTKRLPGILIELKSGKDCTDLQLNELSIAALDQIDNRIYDTDMKSQGIDTILKYGIAFSGKNVCVKADICNNS